MARSEDGEIPEVEAELTRLIESVDPGRDPRLWQLLYYLCQDRATVGRRANRWDEALADLSLVELLIDKLSSLLHGLGRSAVGHARAVILSEPVNPRADLAEAVAQIGKVRKAGHLGGPLMTWRAGSRTAPGTGLGLPTCPGARLLLWMTGAGPARPRSAGGSQLKRCSATVT